MGILKRGNAKHFQSIKSNVKLNWLIIRGIWTSTTFLILNGQTKKNRIMPRTVQRIVGEDIFRLFIVHKHLSRSGQDPVRELTVISRVNPKARYTNSITDWLPHAINLIGHRGGQRGLLKKTCGAETSRNIHTPTIQRSKCAKKKVKENQNLHDDLNSVLILTFFSKWLRR